MTSTDYIHASAHLNTNVFQPPLQFTDLLERVAQLGGRHDGFTGANCRQAAVLNEFAGRLRFRVRHG